MNLFVAVGHNGQRLVSDNGADWKAPALGKEGEVYRCVAFGNGRFAAVGSYASARAFSDGFAPAIGVAAGLSLAGAIAGLVLPRRRPVAESVLAERPRSARSRRPRPGPAADRAQVRPGARSPGACSRRAPGAAAHVDGWLRHPAVDGGANMSDLQEPRESQPSMAESPRVSWRIRTLRRTNTQVSGSRRHHPPNASGDRQLKLGSQCDAN